MSGYYFKTRWDERNRVSEEIRRLGQVHMQQKGRRLRVICPLDEDFRKACIELSGTWRERSGIWSFRIQSFKLVYQAAVKVFGKINVNLVGDIQAPHDLE